LSPHETGENRALSGGTPFTRSIDHDNIFLLGFWVDAVTQHRRECVQYHSEGMSADRYKESSTLINGITNELFCQ